MIDSFRSFSANHNYEDSMTHIISLSKDNGAARRRRVGNGLKPFLTNTLRKPTTQPTKLAKESELVSYKFDKAIDTPLHIHY